MGSIWREVSGVSLAVGVFAAGLAAAPVAGAVGGSVVINEIFYNPANGEPSDSEFVELHNPGDSAVDLTGWTLDDGEGVNAVLSGSLAAGGYAIVTPDGFDAVAYWGVTPMATFVRGLSGGGDTVVVSNDVGAVADSVVYDDTAPWPGEADGLGPSLELIDALTDNALASSWADSVAGPTPGAVNSVTVTPPADPISGVIATPFAPTTNEDIVVVAEVPGGGADPVMFWRKDFEPEQTLTMKDDGVAPDATSGDGVFTATIPDQGSGDLVRYRIVASSGAEFPDGDGRRYEGVVVTNPGEIPTSLVKMEWFIPENDYDSMFDDPTQEVEVEGSVLAIDGVVYDNMDVNIRGGSHARINHDKQGLSFDFAPGVELDRPDMAPYTIDEFALIAERGWTFGRPFSAWNTYYAAGFPVVNAQHVRVQRNGDFYGIFRFSEKLDGTWRNTAGIDGGFYKAIPPGFTSSGTGFEKKQPGGGDNQAVIDLNAELDTGPSSSKTDYLYQDIDIANAVNFIAVTMIVGHFDSKVQNFYLHDDTAGTGRWQIYPWDLSNTFGVNGPSCTGFELEIDCINSEFFDSIMEVPEFEEMVWRRIRTLIDGPVADGELESLATTYMASVSSTEASKDDSDWQAVGSYTTPSWLNTNIDNRRNGFLGHSDLPSSQVSVPGVVMSELTYSPVNGVEFLELHNPLGVSVDLSGWSVDGVGLVFPGGSVVLAGEYFVVTSSVVGFQAAYPSVNDVMLVEFDGGLKGGGELLELRTAEGVLADSVDYDDQFPWPTEPNAGQVSLSLFDSAFDNSLPASWGVSVAIGGTPGRVNDTVPGVVVDPPLVVINEIHYNPAAGGVEFVELVNLEIVPVDLGGFDLDGMIVFDAGTTIAAGDYLVATADLAVFQALYPGVPAVEWLAGETLKNGGEGISLKTDGGVIVDNLDYVDTAPWPTEPDGNGPTLELIDPTLDNGLGGSWMASSLVGGSPGAENVVVTTVPDGVITIEPCLIWNSNTATAGFAGPLNGNDSITLDTTGTMSVAQGGASNCTIPDGASGILIDITASNPLRAGNLRAFPTGQPATGGVVNFSVQTPSLDNSNAIIVPVSTSGELTIEVNAGPTGVGLPSTDIVVTAIGYLDPNGLPYNPVTPCAFTDSRTGTGPYAGPFTGTQTRTVQLTGVFPALQGGGQTDCGVPTTAKAALVNLVAVNPVGSGDIGVRPAGFGPTQTYVSYAQTTPSMNNANAVVVPLSASGALALDSVAGASNSTHVRAVVLGYFHNTLGDKYVPLSPCAAFDSRTNQNAAGIFVGPYDGDETRTMQITGSFAVAQGGGNSTCGVPAGATAVLINTVAVNPLLPGNLQAYATGTSPTGGIVNFADLNPAMNNSNAVVVPLSAAGQINVFANGGPGGIAQPLADVRGVVLGYFI